MNANKYSLKALIQSESYREYILNQGIPNDKIIFYPNPTQDFYKPLKQDKEYQEFSKMDFLIKFLLEILEKHKVSKQ